MAIKFEFWPFSLLKGSSVQSKLTKTFLPAILLLMMLNSYVNSTIFSSLKNPALAAAIELIFALTVFGFIVIIISTTLGKRLTTSQKTLENSEKRFRNAVMYAPFPIMIHAEGEVVMISKAWTDLTGYTLEDIPTIAEWSSESLW